MKVRATIVTVYEFDLDPADFSEPGQKPMTEDEAFEAFRKSVEDDEDYDFMGDNIHSQSAQVEKIS